jgi:hypothetical protein
MRRCHIGLLRNGSAVRPGDKRDDLPDAHIVVGPVTSPFSAIQPAVAPPHAVIVPGGPAHAGGLSFALSAPTQASSEVHVCPICRGGKEAHAPRRQNPAAKHAELVPHLLLFKGVLAALTVGCVSSWRVVRGQAHRPGVAANTRYTEAESLTLPVRLTRASRRGWIQRRAIVVCTDLENLSAV